MTKRIGVLLITVILLVLLVSPAFAQKNKLKQLALGLHNHHLGVQMNLLFFDDGTVRGHTKMQLLHGDTRIELILRSNTTWSCIAGGFGNDLLNADDVMQVGRNGRTIGTYEMMIMPQNSTSGDSFFDVYVVLNVEGLPRGPHWLGQGITSTPIDICE